MTYGSQTKLQFLQLHGAATSLQNHAPHPLGNIWSFDDRTEKVRPEKEPDTFPWNNFWVIFRMIGFFFLAPHWQEHSRVHTAQEGH